MISPDLSILVVADIGSTAKRMRDGRDPEATYGLPARGLLYAPVRMSQSIALLISLCEQHKELQRWENVRRACVASGSGASIAAYASLASH